MLNLTKITSAAENVVLKRKNKTISILVVLLMLGCLAGFNVLAANEIPTVQDIDYFAVFQDMEAEQAQLRERQDIASEMAESARELGYAEDHMIILEAQTVWSEAQAEIEALDAGKADITAKLQVSFKVHEKSGITALGFEKMLDGSGLEGHGQDFYDMEQQSNVNGVFAIAVSRIESGMGVTKYSKERNNHFGLIGKSFNETRDCILYFGQLMNKSMYKEKTIEQIAQVYCPPNRDLWTGRAYDFMNEAWNKMIG